MSLAAISLNSIPFSLAKDSAVRVPTVSLTRNKTLVHYTIKKNLPFKETLFNYTLSMHLTKQMLQYFQFRCGWVLGLGDFSNTQSKGYIGQRPQHLISNSPLPGY